jgi:hypothetical protein
VAGNQEHDEVNYQHNNQLFPQSLNLTIDHSVLSETEFSDRGNFPFGNLCSCILKAVSSQ